MRWGCINGVEQARPSSRMNDKKKGRANTHNRVESDSTLLQGGNNLSGIANCKMKSEPFVYVGRGCAVQSEVLSSTLTRKHTHAPLSS